MKMNREKIKKVYNIITKVLLVIVILIGSFLAVYAGKRLITKDKTASVLGFSFYYVSTGSMAPEINPGDLVIVLEKREYEVGDDITYQISEESTPVTHRIVEINGNEIITEGINNGGSRDTPFDVSCIVGEVVGRWPNYLGFVKFITTPFGIITLVIGVFLMIEGFSLIDKAINKEEKEDENARVVETEQK